MSTADRLEIADLFTRLSRLLDDRRPDDVGLVYTEDVEVHSPRGGELRGTDEVTEYLHQAAVVTEETIHLHGDVLVTVHGDQAEASANQLVYFYRPGEPPHQTSALRVTCQAVRTPSGWRFSKSRITLAWIQTH